VTPERREVLPTAEAIDLKNHPILITLQDVVSGDGFLARITVAGRTLMRQEDDGKWWMYGVRPAAIAESGATVDEAFLRFKQAHTNVLLDTVRESRSFDEFRAEVERFFNEADSDEQEWEDALKAVRDGHTVPHEAFCKLPRQSPDTRPARIEVERLDGKITPFTVRDNATITYSIADKQAA
jgi:predicted RNase H-like HicB family nuclease